MDRLFVRYADPFSFINGMIRNDRFSWFVEQFWEAEYREKNDRELWEFYLYRVYDKSFEDFRNELQINAQNRNMSSGIIETTIKESMNILNKLNPEKGGEA